MCPSRCAANRGHYFGLFGNNHNLDFVYLARERTARAERVRSNDYADGVRVLPRRQSEFDADGWRLVGDVLESLIMRVRMESWRHCPACDAAGRFSLSGQMAPWYSWRAVAQIH